MTRRRFKKKWKPNRNSIEVLGLLTFVLAITGIQAYFYIALGDKWWLNAYWLPVSRSHVLAGFLVLDAGMFYAAWLQCRAWLKRRRYRGTYTLPK
jgi:hypothetical protein